MLAVQLVNIDNDNNGTKRAPICMEMIFINT